LIAKEFDCLALEIKWPGSALAEPGHYLLAGFTSQPVVAGVADTVPFAPGCLKMHSPSGSISVKSGECQ
jgi:hypothetical protein